MSDRDQLRAKAMSLAIRLIIARQQAFGGELPAGIVPPTGAPDKHDSESLVGVLQTRNTLGEETPRGCALVSAAYLDEELENLLRAFFIDDKKAADALISNDGPISAFSARNKLALALGLLSKDVHDEIDYIRKIRNKFAHVSENLTFDSPPIRDWCLKLKDLQEKPREDLRQRFIGSVLRIAASIYVVTNSLKSGALARREAPKQVDMLKHADERLVDETMNVLREVFGIDTTTLVPNKTPDSRKD